MTKLSVLAGLALVAGSIAMTTYAEARSRYNPGARMQVPSRGHITYRPTAANVIPRQALPVPHRIIVRHSETFVRRR